MITEEILKKAQHVIDLYNEEQLMINGENHLLNCPFCGSNAKIIKFNDEEHFDIGCTNENCYLYEGADWHNDSIEEATKRWNKRK